MSLAKINALFSLIIIFFISSSYAEEAQYEGVSSPSRPKSIYSPPPSSFEENISSVSPKIQNSKIEGNAPSPAIGDSLSLKSKPSVEMKNEDLENEKLSQNVNEKEEIDGKKLKNLKEHEMTFFDSLMEMLDLFDIFTDYYFGEALIENENLTKEEVANLRAKNENGKEKIKHEKKVSKDADDNDSEEDDEEHDDDESDDYLKLEEKEIESLLSSYFGVDSSASESDFSLFSSVFPFSLSFFNDDNKENLEEKSLSPMSNVDYLTNFFSFSSFPYFLDAMIAPLVGLLYKGDNMLGRITTVVDLEEKLCLVNVDMSDLPPTAIMRVEVENDGSLIIYFSNGQTMSIAGDNVSHTNLRSSNNDNDTVLINNKKDDSKSYTSYSVLNEKEEEKHNENDSNKNINVNTSSNILKSSFSSSSLSSLSTPDITSTVYSTSTFLLDKRCDTSSDNGKATIVDQKLILKFKLKKCALDVKLECTQKPEDDDNAIEQHNDNVSVFNVKNGMNDDDDDDDDRIYDADKLYMKSGENAEKEIVKQLEEDEKFKKEYDELIQKREQLRKAGPVSDPLYMGQLEAAKKKRIVPLVKLEEF